MTPAQKKNSGASFKALKAIPPQDAAAGAISGNSDAGHDRTGFGSCQLHVAVGAASGTPDSFSVAGKLQESDSESTGYTDISGAAITSITADNGEARVNVDLSGCKKYIRAVVTPAFVNGTSPKVEVAATIVLGGPDTVPYT
jgi:hypothetical protein